MTKPDTIKVKALTEHRHNGEPVPVGKIYDLPADIAPRAISEGWVVAVEEKKK
jgi:hypothetical protein